jgi:hypothetical protein
MLKEQQQSLESRVAKRFREFLEASLPFVDRDGLRRREEKRLALVWVSYGALQQISEITTEEVDAEALSRADYSRIMFQALRDCVRWPPDVAAHLNEVALDNLEDPELLEIVAVGREAVTAAQQGEEDAHRYLAEVLDGVAAEEDVDPADDRPLEERPDLGDQPRKQFSRARAVVYEDLFGDKFTRFDCQRTRAPRIDVLVFEPQRDGQGWERDWFTIVTSGMSDLRMKVSAGFRHTRAELILYVAEPKELYVELLQWLAGLPHDQEGTWYGHETTMTNGQPPQPIFAGSELDCFLFAPTPVVADHAVDERLSLEGDPFTFLHVVPITRAECDFILRHDHFAFRDILDERQHPFVLDERRRSYV